ncbi:MAG TPA: GNAT family N-acetyltransferase, partial [Symbiobacteriaceae bacterium]|nr:GNAT family N-acetyltransferase [Symbiobacteriaceae bacterium]
MHFHLRPGVLPADFHHMATILNATHTVQTSPAELAEHHNWWPAGSISCLTMACDEAGQVIGFAEAHRFPNTAEGKFYADLAVLPTFAGHGAGSALLADVEQFIASHGATRIFGDVQDNDAASLAYVEKRGYKVERHWFTSRLDLSSFDPSAFPAPEVEGIRFFTLADDDTPAMRRALYELYGRTMPDIPGYEAKSFMTYETWERFMFDGDDPRTDWVVIAADGDRLVGVTQMVTEQDH